jgi:hypothetical protein
MQALRTARFFPCAIERRANMTLVIDTLQPQNQHGEMRPLHGNFYPVVAVRASSGGSGISPGIGFFLSQWPSCLITARHVIMADDGSKPDAIEITAWNGTAEVPITAARFAFYSPDDERHADADVAVVRIRGNFPNPFRKGRPPAQSSTDVALLSYEDGEDFVTQAWLDRPWLRLSDLGAHGMSGGPVLLAPSDGRKPRDVVGVYHGENDTPGDVAKAYAIDARAVIDCLNALVGR